MQHFYFFTNYFQYLGILIPVILLVFIVIVILRVNENTFFSSFRSITYIETKKERPVVSIQNPFGVSVSSDGKSLDFSLQKASCLHLLWGVVITEFFTGLQKSWVDIKEELEAANWLNDSTLFTRDVIELNPGQHRHEFDRPSEASGEKLGQRPRSRYPLVVITMIKDTEDFDISSPFNVIAMFTVIHVQDSICTGETHILYQYLKTVEDKIIPLQPLFVQPKEQEETATTMDSYKETSSASNTSNIDKSDQERKFSYNDENFVTECVVCQNNEAIIAILPCRHTCICNACLEQLDKCPLCRGYIFSYFRTSDSANSENSYINRSHEHAERDISHIHRGESRWESFNRRLNEMLGFD